VTVVRALVDTNTLILLAWLDPSYLPDEPLISAVTLAELSVGPLVARSDEERARRQAHLQEAESSFDPLPFDADAARAFGRIAAARRRAGRKPSARAFDAMIAATAVANGLALHTCNAGAFTGLDELELVAVPHPDRP
jgi:predicted nucleic acid-binding protein